MGDKSSRESQSIAIFNKHKNKTITVPPKLSKQYARERMSSRERRVNVRRAPIGGVNLNTHALHDIARPFNSPPGAE